MGEIGRYTIGAVVQMNPKRFHAPRLPLGHITGFGVNAQGETLLRVRWDEGNEGLIHPSAVILDPPTWPGPWSEAEALRRLSKGGDDG